MKFLAFLTAIAALTMLATATPLERRQGVTCMPKYSGILRSANRNDLSVGANVVVAAGGGLDLSLSSLISIGGGTEAGTQCIFEKCTQATGWGSEPPHEYGQIRMASNKDYCVTASGDWSSDGGKALYMDKRTTDTNEALFARQYFSANYVSVQGTVYVTLELTGGPDGQYNMPCVGTVQKGNNNVVTAHKTGTQVLVLVDVEILSEDLH